MSAPSKYETPPKRVFRQLGLGKLSTDGTIPVIAGFKFKWWVPDDLGPVEPIIVAAKVLRVREATKNGGALADRKGR